MSTSLPASWSQATTVELRSAVCMRYISSTHVCTTYNKQYMYLQALSGGKGKAKKGKR